VRVEIGVGSLIPLEVIASGEWPSSCAQLAETNLRFVDLQQIQVELLASPETSSCAPSQQGLPFNIRIPLNPIELPTGKYSVMVNGVQADFDWNNSPSDSAGHFPVGAEPGMPNLVPIRVDEIHVEIGVGSPIPVDVVITAGWPSLCAQLVQVKSEQSGQQFNVSLLASPDDATCPPDLLGLSYPVHLPLNMSGQPAGHYTVSVNGSQTGFDWPAAPSSDAPQPSPMRMVYVGADGNVYIADLPDGLPVALTVDATSPESSTPPSVSYNDPSLSFDGKFVAYRRQVGVAQGDGMSFHFGLWVVDLARYDSQEIYALSPAGFSWQPGTHLLAYIPELQNGYFMARGEKPDASLANGVQGYDADRGTTSELVKPERGYALYSPVWSPDGRFLSFDEVLFMEGRGPFAYYDFTAQRYVAWDEPLGMYSWAPDGEALAFDNLTYTAVGDEQIRIRTRQDGTVSDFSPKQEQGYAIMPTFSPQGDRIAYLANLDGSDSVRFTLQAQPFHQGDPVKLGEYENIYRLNWSPDGSSIIFSHGTWGEQVIVAVDLQTGASRELASGTQPALSVIP
jgi:hypothetical protein